MIPDWFTEWVVFETDNWHLKPDAPEHIQKEFAEWMKQHESTDEKDVD